METSAATHAHGNSLARRSLKPTKLADQTSRPTSRWRDGTIAQAARQRNTEKGFTHPTFSFRNLDYAQHGEILSDVPGQRYSPRFAQPGTCTFLSSLVGPGLHLRLLIVLSDTTQTRTFPDAEAAFRRRARGSKLGSRGTIAVGLRVGDRTLLQEELTGAYLATRRAGRSWAEGARFASATCLVARPAAPGVTSRRPWPLT